MFSPLLDNAAFRDCIVRVKNDRVTGLEKRAALWAAGHVGSSELGIAFLVDTGVLESILDQCLTSASLSLRGTCLMILGLLSSTDIGRRHLTLAGWSHTEREFRQCVVEREVWRL